MTDQVITMNMNLRLATDGSKMVMHRERGKKEKIFYLELHEKILIQILTLHTAQI